MSYIEKTDVKHSKLASKVSDDDIIDLDNWFENFVLSKGLLVSEIASTLNDDVKTMLIYKTSMDVSERYIGINPRAKSRAGGDSKDSYQVLFDHFEGQFLKYRDKMNSDLIINTINNETDTSGDGIELFRS